LSAAACFARADPGEVEGVAPDSPHPRARALPAVGVVVATRDRREALLGSLGRLTALPGPPPVVVVDNGSSDGTPAAVRAAFPRVEVIEAGANLGTGARNLGVDALDTPVVAFADDDSWWAADALGRLAAAFAAGPRLGLVAARVLVGPDERLDPTCEAMRASPLPADPELPGPRVLGFVACGSAVRRDAFLAVGGFEQRLGLMGEEELLALDLAAAGWELCYLDDVVAHHHPLTSHDRSGRRALQERNRLWSLWLRRPLRVAVGETGRVLARAPGDAVARRALVSAAAGAGWVSRARRPLPPGVERDVRRLEAVG
jgi:GT2 family glycosyltransferase